MGLVIKAALGALVVVLIGLLAKTKNYYIAGLIPLFPTFALIAHYIVASERGIEALRTTIVFSMWSIYSLFCLPCFTVVFHRVYALTHRARRCSSVLEPERVVADLLLDQTALTQMTPTIKGKTTPGDKTTS